MNYKSLQIYQSKHFVIKQGVYHLYGQNKENVSILRKFLQNLLAIRKNIYNLSIKLAKIGPKKMTINRKVKSFNRLKWISRLIVENPRSVDYELC